jgi:hypothetical protein
MPRRAKSDAGGTFQFLVALPTEWAQQLDAAAKQDGASRMALVRSAIGALLSERQGETYVMELSDDLRIDLAALRDAMDTASTQTMIARALREYIDGILATNSGMRARFKEARKQIIENGEGGSGKVIEFRRTRR